MLQLQRVFGRYFLRQQCSKRFFASACVENVEELSVRTKAWLEAQSKYAKFPHLYYSSYIESLAEHLPFNKKKWISTRSTDEVAIQRLLDEVELRRLGKDVDMPEDVQFPPNWMDDYEFYGSGMDEEGNINSNVGTADPNIKPSKVPCNGCGAHLHCTSVSLPGFIPREIFKGRTVNELKTITCQRCHFLKHYNIALDLEISAESYIKTISDIQDKYALAIIIVDLFDMPCSIWPNMQKILGSKRPVFVVGNKVDLLPRDSTDYLRHIKEMLKNQIIKSGFNDMNIQHIELISAKTGYGIEELITQLHKKWARKGDVYLLGCTNVGKSSLFNILLNSDYCRPEATDLVRKATTCPWPGTTLKMLKFPILKPSEIRVYYRLKRLMSERGQRAAEEKLRKDQARKTGLIKHAQLIGRVGRSFDTPKESDDIFSMSSGTQPITTINERDALYRNCKWCFDTPGVLHPDQFTNLLTTEELLKLSPKQMIQPRGLRLKPGMSLFVGGLARVDYVGGSLGHDRWIRVYAFSSGEVPLAIANTAHAEEVYKQYLGTKLLAIPCGSNERLMRWPGLQSLEEEIKVLGIEKYIVNCDIVLSSAGWLGLEVPENEECIFKVWTPFARGIHKREPALIPHANRLIGKHIRNTLSYNLNQPFVFIK